MKLKSADEIVVGRVLYITTSKMRPKDTGLNQYAMVKKHPFVCTYRDVSGKTSQWLMLTSDEYRGDKDCVFTPDDKTGLMDPWCGKPSYFSKHCQSTVSDEDIIKFSDDDSWAQVNTVKESALLKYGFSIKAPAPKDPVEKKS